jgi:hypothetical protein
MIEIGLFAAGVLLGMWLGKHPDDARTYGEALWARARALVGSSKKTP